MDLVVATLGFARRQERVVHPGAGRPGEHARNDGDPEVTGQASHGRGPGPVEGLGDLGGCPEEGTHGGLREHHHVGPTAGGAAGRVGDQRQVFPGIDGGTELCQGETHVSTVTVRYPLHDPGVFIRRRR